MKVTTGLLVHKTMALDKNEYWTDAAPDALANEFVAGGEELMCDAGAPQNEARTWACMGVATSSGSR